jgi:hypothetical protein
LSFSFPTGLSSLVGQPGDLARRIFQSAVRRRQVAAGPPKIFYFRASGESKSILVLAL